MVLREMTSNEWLKVAKNIADAVDKSADALALAAVCEAAGIPAPLVSPPAPKPPTIEERRAALKVGDRIKDPELLCEGMRVCVTWWRALPGGSSLTVTQRWQDSSGWDPLLMGSGGWKRGGFGASRPLSCFFIRSAMVSSQAPQDTSPPW